MLGLLYYSIVILLVSILSLIIYCNAAEYILVSIICTSTILNASFKSLGQFRFSIHLNSISWSDIYKFLLSLLSVGLLYNLSFSTVKLF